jgi:hypothetical protein
MGWTGTLNGRIDPGDLDGVPLFIDLGDLGVSDTESGWLGEADFGFARRHRLRFVGSDRSTDGMTTVSTTIDIGGIEVPVDIPLTSRFGIREFEANYNLLVVANSGVDVGVLAGVGYFDATVSASTPVGDVDEQFDTPYPSLGGNALVNPLGRFRTYLELTGFPRVTVDDFTGWKMSVIARVEIFLTQNVGVYAGYRTYEIDLQEESSGLDFNLRWKGLIVGGAVRF